MTKVIGVRFRTAGKIYYFSPGKFEIKQGDHVIVETARGVEYGKVVIGTRKVKDQEVIQPLKSVIRIATEQASHGTPALQDPTGGKILDALSIAADKVELENVPAQEALDEAQKTAQEALDAL